ncbi:MAG: hypothetical protein RLZZ74_3433 [Cyanobacteriota bacterium]|jgi:hypothetical protein
MTNPAYFGYLEEPYLTYSYMSGRCRDHYGTEVKRVIQDDLASGLEIDRRLIEMVYSGIEVDRSNPGDDFLGTEVERTIESMDQIGLEIERKISTARYSGVEVERSLGDTQFSGVEITREKYISSWHCREKGYLSEDYLTKRYLVDGICAHIGLEIDRKIVTKRYTGVEMDRAIKTYTQNGVEVERVIEAVKAIGAEINLLRALNLGSQIRFVLYNTTKLRILSEFPSRGTNGLNWTASSTLAGDFSVNNVNNDIVEYVWRSNSSLSATLVCDTQLVQGVAPDTFAFLNHNWSSSAVVTFEGSNSPTFASVGITLPIEATSINSYYISPTFPTTQYRYWRLTISDPTNPEGFLQVGTIIFGNSIIFQGEDIVDRIRRKMRHFSSKVKTEGFTNVSNDRALKRSIVVNFNSLDYRKGNFDSLINVFETARTSLKCLWLPDPQDPKRFGVFGKLVDIPEEEHENRGDAADIVTLAVEIDESL